MREAENIDQVVKAIRKVPPTNLLLIELANSLPLKGGTFDYEVLTEKQLEVNLALQESKMYGAYTMLAVNALLSLKGVNESHVGPATADIPE